MRTWLVALPLAGSVVAAMAGDPGTVAIGDNENYTIGAYLAYMAPFNKGALVRGVDYEEVTKINPETFPNATRISWRWPSTPCPKGIYNFDAIDFGNSNFTVVQKPIPSRRLFEIGTLTETHDIVLSGRLADFDVITDVFVTSSPGDLSKKVNEIELFWHTPPYSAAYFDHVTPLGTFRRAGRTWKVAVDRKTIPWDVLVMPVDQRDLLTAKIDIKEIMDALVEMRAVSADAYFNGLAMGSEVRANEGSTNIRTFAVDYK